ncbi:hypothetical protein K502DRAFT_327238 [Neoconidiobolus thromboides FSU 785]|nr:hypothetical protein K502DRAFT_327238 [Neoconidiobolus thromboides FSU 785]
MTKDMVKGKLISEPKWLKAAEKFPNSTSFVRSPSTFTIDAALPFETDFKKINKIVQFSSNNALKGKATLKKTKFVSPIPPKIVYPEDELRKEFFKDHPFELVRPVSLVEKDGTPGESWAKLLSEDKSKKVSSEDVIKFQLYLMTQGITKNEAYEIATRELTKHRIAEEYEEEMAINQAKKLGVKLSKDAVQQGLEQEAIHLEKSREAIELSDALRKSQEFTAEKSFKEEEPISNPNL